MTKKIYTTSRGQRIDMEELRSQNAHRVASGNMQVNAQGDTLGPGGTVIQRVADRVRSTAQPRTTRTTSVKPPVNVTDSVQPAQSPEPVTPAESVTQEHMDADGNITVTSEPEPAANKKTKKAKAKAKTSEVSNEDSSTE